MTRLAFTRELFAGCIAVLVFVLFIVLLRDAMGKVHKADEFAAVKDLLLLVNPIVGLVVGYYFSRATSEARAEHAEATVVTTARTAEQATQAMTSVSNQVQSATEKAAEMANSLESLAGAVDRSRARVQEAAQVPFESGVQNELDAAVERARRVLARWP